MEKPPMEWIDKLFDCMMLFYGDRWAKRFTLLIPQDLFKKIWQSALEGLSYEEIRCALVFHKRRAVHDRSLAPTHFQFFQDARICGRKSKNYK